MCMSSMYVCMKVRTTFPPTPPVDDTQIIVVTATVSSELQKKVNMIIPVSAPLYANIGGEYCNGS